MNIVIQTPGSALKIINGNFALIVNDQQHLIPPDKVKSITVGKSASITSDAILKAIEKEIDIVFVDNLGHPQGRVWSHKYGSVSSIRIKQTEFVFSPQASQFILQTILNKIDGNIAVLLYLKNLAPDKENQILRSITALNDYKSKISQIKPDIITEIAHTLRGWEGIASKKYFETVAKILPPEYNFNKRGTPPATDPVNAILNYLYGILYSKIEAALIKAGLDPYLGIYHRNDYNRPTLVFDIIEEFRHWADYVTFSFAMHHSIDVDTWFEIKEDGTHWLDYLGKRVVITSFNDYLSEIITINGLPRSRDEHIHIYARQLAQNILHFDQNTNDKLQNRPNT